MHLGQLGQVIVRQLGDVLDLAGAGHVDGTGAVVLEPRAASAVICSKAVFWRAASSEKALRMIEGFGWLARIEGETVDESGFSTALPQSASDGPSPFRIVCRISRSLSGVSDSSDGVRSDSIQPRSF